MQGDEPKAEVVKKFRQMGLEAQFDICYAEPPLDFDWFEKQIRSKVYIAILIDSPTYQPDLYSGISYKDAMGRIHAINESGEILKDVAVFREAYRLIGLGWIYAPTNWPILGSLIDKVYKVWAQWRLPLIRRPSLEQLCKEKELCKLKKVRFFNS